MQACDPHFTIFATDESHGAIFSAPGQQIGFWEAVEQNWRFGVVSFRSWFKTLQCKNCSENRPRTHVTWHQLGIANRPVHHLYTSMRLQRSLAWKRRKLEHEQSYICVLNSVRVLFLFQIPGIPVVFHTYNV